MWRSLRIAVLAATMGRTKFLPGLLVALDEAPWAQLWRIILGYAIVPAWLKLDLPETSDWTLFPFFVGALIVVRLVPAVIRKLLPFDADVQATWGERRRLAKRFDSYQWQKLFWIALGLTTYTFLSVKPFPVVVALTAICVAAGSSGLLFWGLRGRTSA